MRTFISIKNGIFLLLFVLMLACGHKNQPNSSPKLYVVEIKDMQFQPAEIRVNKGDTVMWINKDIVPHDATEKDSAWASPPLGNEVTWKKVITKSDAYYCSIHVVMKGELIVN